MPREIQAGETVAARRRVYGQFVGADGITPATGEAGGQPQVSVNGAAFADAGIGTLTHLGDGRYYAELDAATVANAGDWIETRYKSGGTAECPLDSVQVVAYDLAIAPGVGGGVASASQVAAMNGTLASVYVSGQAVLNKLNAAGLTVTVAVVVPADGGDVSIVNGDDYRAADGSALSWTVLTDLDLSAAQSLTLTVYDGVHETAGPALSVACAASAITDGYTLSADLTAEQTGALTPRFAGPGNPPSYGGAVDPRRRYEVVAVLSNGHVRTLLSGFVTVTE